MEKNMQVNFELLKDRVLDALDKTDLEYIRYELSNLKESAIISGVGGSSVVSEFLKKVLEYKNNIITINVEPRDFVYRNLSSFKNVISCSYSGNNYGVKLAFNNNLKHYLLSNNSFYSNNVTYLKYNTSIEKEKSFISLGATLIPISILLNYYLDNSKEILIDSIRPIKFEFNTNVDSYEIFTGYDTSTASKYLESTMVESGIGIPIIHDKYSFCHGRSTTAINFNNLAIHIDRKTELDKLLLDELKDYYKDIVILRTCHNDSIIDDYQMLISAMYLTKYIAEQKNKDLSAIEYSKVVRKIYQYSGKL